MAADEEIICKTTARVFINICKSFSIFAGHTPHPSPWAKAIMFVSNLLVLVTLLWCQILKREKKRQQITSIELQAYTSHLFRHCFNKIIFKSNLSQLNIKIKHNMFWQFYPHLSQLFSDRDLCNSKWSMEIGLY